MDQSLKSCVISGQVLIYGIYFNIRLNISSGHG